MTRKWRIISNEVVVLIHQLNNSVEEYTENFEFVLISSSSITYWTFAVLWYVYSTFSISKKQSSSNYYNLSTMILCIEYQNFVLWSCFEGLAVFDLENVLESKKELKTIWNLTLKSGPIYNTWQFQCRQPWDLIPLSKIVSFTKRFHCCSFPNHSKTVFTHMQMISINHSLMILHNFIS